MSSRQIVDAQICVPLSIDRASWSHEEPISVGVPFPSGAVRAAGDLAVLMDGDVVLPTQVEVLSSWPDGSARWVLVDVVLPSVDVPAPSLSLRLAPGTAPAEVRPLEVNAAGTSRVEVTTGAFRFVLHGSGDTLLEAERVGETAPRGCCAAHAVDAKGRRARVTLRSAQVIVEGPVRCTVRLSGSVQPESGTAWAEVSAWVHLYAGRGLVRTDFMVRNPHPARHAGGLWDLGDPASLLLRDLYLEWMFADGSAGRPSWWLQVDEGEELHGSGAAEIGQAASGGAHWNSVNHVDHSGEVRLPFPGFRLRSSSREEEGARCHPVVALANSAYRLSASVHQFWQQFPKALEADTDGLRARLFPTWGEETHELQGGEQKRHTVEFLFEEADAADRPDVSPRPLRWVERPATVTPSPAHYEESGVFESFVREDAATRDDLAVLLRRAAHGDASFFRKREAADEYGWRHFGEVYADHEQRYYKGQGPLVSHYNNQYDLLYGLLRQGARTGDARCLELATDLARHVIDIDIYHTRDDRPQYSLGLFWHTDHYLSAGRATHRCYSKDNAPAGSSTYGGGPSGEHCYTTGLLYYYYMTGDPLARESVIDLADWIINMDDGRKTVLGQLDDGPTGLASQTAAADYHGPGRGGGNAVNTLLDGYRATGRGVYLEKAEELIRRCIHPDDRPDEMEFDNLELRWSYLVFLQVLGRYLDFKMEREEPDESFEYARACLDRYACWMLEKERPYSEVLDRVEFPTETWPAHDFRKSCIFDLATRYGDPARALRYREKAEAYYEAATSGLLSFETCVTTRPLAICLSLAGVRDHFARTGPSSENLRPPDWKFAPREPFVPQKARVKRLARSVGGLLRIAAFLMKPAHLSKLISRRMW